MCIVISTQRMEVVLKESKSLRVELDHEDHALIKEAAKLKKLTVSQFVRNVMVKNSRSVKQQSNK